MSPSAAAGATPFHDAFVSYSRRDSAFAQALIEQLERKGRTIVYDRGDIHDGEAWRRKLTSLIEESQNVIVLISQAWLDSRECRWELDLAGTLNKRLVPMRIDTVAPVELPESLAAIQWIDATGTTDTEAIAARVIAALDIDQQWTERHTRLTFQALAWREHGTLLRGADLRNAETLLATYQGKQPLPTAEHMALLLASRKASARRMRVAVLGTAAVGLALALLSVNWLAERRNAEFIGLRRQAESALNQADGDLAAAVASLGYVVRADSQGALSEYGDVVAFWQAQLRAIDDIVPGMKIGDPLLWRGTLHVKTDAQQLRPLSGGTPMLVAPGEDNRYLVTADYSTVALLTLPGLEPLVQLHLPARVRPDSIVAIPATGWLLTAGTQTVVNNDEDDPVSTYDCFTLVMPDGIHGRPFSNPPQPVQTGEETRGMTRLSGERGSMALHFCPEVNLIQISVSADTTRRYLLLDEHPGEAAAKLMIDVLEGSYVTELPASTGWDTRTKVTLPAGASQVHAFAQVIAEAQHWREALGPELEKLKQSSEANQQQQAQQLLDTADATHLEAGQQAVLANLGEVVEGPGLIIDKDASFLWGLYITGNSYAAYGACRFPAGTQRAEWCRSHEILAIGSSRMLSPDQRWAFITNRDGWAPLLELIDLTTLKGSELKALPTLVVAQAFDAVSSRLALLSETNGLSLYTLDHSGAPQLLQQIALGETTHERCINAANPQTPQEQAATVAFVAERLLVGLGTDGLLFGIDSQSGELLWRRPLQTGIDKCGQGLSITPAGTYFALHGADAVQLFHALSGVPLSGVVTVQALTGTSTEGAYFEHLRLSPNGDLSVTTGDRVFVRPRSPTGTQPGLEHYTGISAEDGRTPLKVLPGAYEP